MSKWYLLEYNDNYADEFDVDGHVVLGEEEYNEFKAAIDQDPSFTFYVGTNEDIEYESGDSWYSAQKAYEIKEITEEQLKVLQDLNLVSRGFASSFVEKVIETTYDGEGDCDW